MEVRKFNVLHTISGLSLKSGGPSLSVYQLVKELREKGLDARILCLATKDPNEKLISKDNFIRTIELSNLKILGYSKSLSLFFQEDSNYDIYHLHGLWELFVHKMVYNARKNKKPYLITPRGMLRPWALNQSKIKKQIALWLYQKKDLREASCLHATAKIEADEIRELGFENPIAVIPNGINLSEYSVRKVTKNKTTNTILYLSRVFPKKGLESLIEAWAYIPKSERKDWEMIIAGNGAEKYINQLQSLIKKRLLENEIKFIGPRYGSEKVEIFHQADLFVLPTLGENFGMAIAEALACGIPVITTKGAPWEDLVTHNAGWWIDIGVEPLAKALTEAMKLSDEERIRMGLNGRKLVEENYSIESVAQKMIHLYEWILNKREKPEFVY